MSKTSSSVHTVRDLSDTENLSFTNKPSSMNTMEFATARGFVFDSPNKKVISQKKELSEASIKSRLQTIEQKIESDEWINSPMRDRMHRLKVYGPRKEVFVNRDGEENVRFLFPAFNSHEMEGLLDKMQREYAETKDPCCLHDWRASAKYGCSEVELRDTILDLRTAEESYPPNNRRSRTFYITDEDGFTTKVRRRRRQNKDSSSKQTKLSKREKNDALFKSLIFNSKNVADLDD